MSHRLPTLLGLAVALVLLPLRSLATSVEPPAFDQLVGMSDYVVRATVKSVTSAWRDKNGHHYIATQVALDVKEVIRGTPPNPLVLDMVGGKVGEEELRVEGAPQFNVGDEGIFFVHGNGTYLSPLVGIMHGLYPIFKDAKTGTEYAVRSNGMPLYSEQDVSLPMTKLSPVKARNPAALPMTAAAFISKIRAAAPANTASDHVR